jgi:hypothetical protein
MHRSVVTHQRTGWCRIHCATSRCPAGSDRRWYCPRGGKRVAWATMPPVTRLFPHFQPEQKAIGQHQRHGMPMKPLVTSGPGAGPRPALPWRPYDTARSHAADAPIRPTLSEWFPRTGYSRNISAPRATPRSHAPRPASPHAVAHHWPPANTARPQTSCAASLWSPAAIASRAPASAACAGGMHLPATWSCSPCSHTHREIRTYRHHIWILPGLQARP